MKNGSILWITGYAGAGKSTIAREVALQLRGRGLNVILLDGDEFRKAFSEDLGHSPEDRLENAWRIAKCAIFLSSQGVHVIAPTVSLYEDVRSWLRKNGPGYREIYIRVSKETLFSRDQKGLYSGALAGTIINVAGVNLDVDEPKNADLIIDNDGLTKDFSHMAKQIISLI